MALLLEREGAEIQANTSTVGRQSVGKVAALAGGGFVVVSVDDPTPASGDSNAKYQLFNATGNKIGGEVLVNPGPIATGSVDVAGLENGGFVVGCRHARRRPDGCPHHGPDVCRRRHAAGGRVHGQRRDN